MTPEQKDKLACTYESHALHIEQQVIVLEKTLETIESLNDQFDFLHTKRSENTISIIKAIIEELEGEKKFYETELKYLTVDC